MVNKDTETKNPFYIQLKELQKAYSILVRENNRLRRIIRDKKLK